MSGDDDLPRFGTSALTILWRDDGTMEVAGASNPAESIGLLFMAIYALLQDVVRNSEDDE